MESRKSIFIGDGNLGAGVKPPFVSSCNSQSLSAACARRILFQSFAEAQSA